jgi:hypothetical protein
LTCGFAMRFVHRLFFKNSEEVKRSRTMWFEITG